MKTTEFLPIIRNIFFAILVFRLEQAKCAVSTCGGTLKRRTDTFTSPNYPFPPKPEPSARAVGSSPGDDDRIICEWEITVPDGLEILLNFGDFDMAAGLDECQKGELEVFSGIKNKKKTLDKYCGSDDLDKVHIESNSATVVFRRPKTFSGKGFLVSYIATEPGGSIDAFVTCADRGSDHIGVGTFSVLCPGGCANLKESNVWGTMSYRDNSYLCKAAVHAGLISDYFGGRVSVKRVPGDLLYMGFAANGIKTLSGSMSDFKIQFLNKTTCDRKLMFNYGDLSASSYWIPDGIQDKGTWKPRYGILNNQIFAWGPADPTKTQWLQVDLKKVFMITAIETKGSTTEYYTTKSYRIAYSNDSLNWNFYKEQGLRKDKVFSGNQNIFQASRNNFVEPRIVARYVRVYPTPVNSEKERYSLQMQLSGCPTKIRIPKTTTTTTISTRSKTAVSTETMSTNTETTRKIIVQPPVITIGTNTTPTIDHVTTPLVLFSEEEETVPELVAPVTDKPPNKMNENSIIVIGIVAALAITSILLAALVLFLVRKRKKVPKHQLNHIQNNNNNKFFKNKKNKKRGKNNGEEFQNISYRDTIDNFLTLDGAVNIVPSATLPADQVRFVNGNGGTSYIAGKAISSEEDDEDHEYQVIADDFTGVNGGPVPLPSRPISSKHSTGSSMGSSRKSDTMQRPNIIDSWNKPPFGTNSPTFSIHQRSIHAPNPTFSSFSPNMQDTFPYPGNGPQVTRPGTFKDIRYSTGPGMITEGVPGCQIHPGIRRGSSQSPTGPNRHSSSSNNSSHSHPVAMPTYPHGNLQQHAYYPSAPTGENQQPVTALNHTGYLMYGDQTIPENEMNGIKRKQPSYKTPRQFSFEAPHLPEKNTLVYDPRKDIDRGYGSRGGSDPDITEEQNDVMGHMKSHSVNLPQSQDYDRLYRNNSLNDGNITNNYSTLNGSHSQYNQLDLNAAPV